MDISSIIKRMLENGNAFLSLMLNSYNYLPFNDKLKLHGNKLRCTGALLKKCKIIVIWGVPLFFTRDADLISAIS